MNIFYLDKHPFLAAFHMCRVPKHIVKMPLESMQILSTNLRLTHGVYKEFEDDLGEIHTVNVLEGEKVLFADVVWVTYQDGTIKRLKHSEHKPLPKKVVRIDMIKQTPYYDPDTQVALAMTHENHPSTVWARQSVQNHRWLVKHTFALETFWKAFYGHPESLRHASVRLLDKMPEPDLPDTGFTDPTPAMGEEYIVEGDSIASYWNYYRGTKIGKI